MTTASFTIPDGLALIHAIHGHAGTEQAEGVAFENRIEGDPFGVEIGSRRAEGCGANGEEAPSGTDSVCDEELALAREDMDVALVGIVIHVTSDVGGIFRRSVKQFRTDVGVIGVPVRPVPEFGYLARGASEDEEVSG